MIKISLDETQARRVLALVRAQMFLASQVNQDHTYNEFRDIYNILESEVE